MLKLRDSWFAVLALRSGMGRTAVLAGRRMPGLDENLDDAVILLVLKIESQSKPRPQNRGLLRFTEPFSK